MAKQARPTKEARADDGDVTLTRSRFVGWRNADDEDPDGDHPTAILERGPGRPRVTTTKIAAPVLEPGSILEGRYRIERVIGEGGMSTVYLAHHVRIDAPVAIKVLAASVARIEGARERFLLEARAASSIHHPNVVVVSDYGVLPSGLPFMVMEYLPGDNLETLRLREGPMPWSRVRRIALQLCDALQTAHDDGVIHRDVKPHNCVLERETSLGELVKVLDFGIAKVDPRDGEAVLDDVLVGTPSYMAPEQAQQQSVDHRADIYSLGVMMFVLLTGELPFRASDPYEEMRMHVRTRPPLPSSLRPDLDLRIDAVLMRAMAKDRERRFSSMRQMAAAIEAIGDAPEEPSGPRPVAASGDLGAEDSSDRMMVQLRVRNRWIVPAGISAALAAAAVLTLYDRVWLRVEPWHSDGDPIAVGGALERAIVRSPRPGVKASVADVSNALASLRATVPSLPVPTPAAVVLPEGSPPDRTPRGATLEAVEPAKPRDVTRPRDTTLAARRHDAEAPLESAPTRAQPQQDTTEDLGKRPPSLPGVTETLDARSAMTRISLPTGATSPLPIDGAEPARSAGKRTRIAP